MNYDKFRDTLGVIRSSNSQKDKTMQSSKEIGHKEKHLITKHNTENYKLSNMNPLLVLIVITCTVKSSDMDTAVYRYVNMAYVTLTRRVPIVEEELITLPEHMSSSPVLVGFVLFDLQFYEYVLQVVVCPFVLFLLTIVFSVILRCPDSD